MGRNGELKAKGGAREIKEEMSHCVTIWVWSRHGWKGVGQEFIPFLHSQMAAERFSSCMIIWALEAIWRKSVRYSDAAMAMHIR